MCSISVDIIIAVITIGGPCIIYIVKLEKKITSICQDLKWIKDRIREY